MLITSDLDPRQSAVVMFSNTPRLGFKVRSNLDLHRAGNRAHGTAYLENGRADAERMYAGDGQYGAARQRPTYRQSELVHTAQRTQKSELQHVLELRRAKPKAVC